MPDVPTKKVFDRYSLSAAGGLASRSRALLESQKKTWPACGRGNEALGSVQVRPVTVNGFDVRVQWNPQRIVSTSANVDPKAIAERPCFLCVENLPPEQMGILCDGQYLVLCNPSPIFPEHFTLSHVDHRPQAIDNLLPTMIDLTRAFDGEFAVFYNGPKCGASAPDHLHLQAIPSGSMPVDRDIRTFTAMMPHDGGGPVSTWSIDGYGRTHAILSSRDRKRLAKEGESFIQRWRSADDSRDEPLMNVVSLLHGDLSHLLFFLRSKHRPDAFFRTDDGRLMVSPASVDMGGHIVTPRAEDFRRLDETLIAGIFREVSETEDKLVEILNG